MNIENSTRIKIKRKPPAKNNRVKCYRSAIELPRGTRRIRWCATIKEAEDYLTETINEIYSQNGHIPLRVKIDKFYFKTSKGAILDWLNNYWENDLLGDIDFQEIMTK